MINKECSKKQHGNSIYNTGFIILILFILMAIITGGRFF